MVAKGEGERRVKMPKNWWRHLWTTSKGSDYGATISVWTHAQLSWTKNLFTWTIWKLKNKFLLFTIFRIISIFYFCQVAKAVQDDAFSGVKWQSLLILIAFVLLMCLINIIVNTTFSVLLCLRSTYIKVMLLMVSYIRFVLLADSGEILLILRF